MNSTLQVPFDVKLMNATASVLFVVCAVGGIAAVAWWALRHPVFTIAGITINGDTQHNNALTLRANVAPKLVGNFFTVDLARARAAFEAVPWVRRAVVRREFPNRLGVTLQEHQAVAFWGDEDGSRLVNSQGEVFEANAGDVEQDNLPRLRGPEGQSAEVLTMYLALKPLFDPLDLGIEELMLSGRGGWRVELDTGAEVELGRGSVQEVQARTEVFVNTLTQVTSRYGRRPDMLESADLRHTQGYAVRLRGVTTVVPDAQKK
ncbi:cell division protein FtsQ/DivIB [Variovorax sp. VNK109]|uniref:cell division protein FtsQ/DivIB n=1 Tax=Variovorax sp. VNK109 TaxID=3400919 RepID=UPI003BFC61EA